MLSCEGQCQDWKTPKGPKASLRAYQSNTFNNFDNSLFFVIVRPKNVRRSVGSCKTWEQIL